MTGEAVIHVSAITAGFGDHVVLRDLDLDVLAGEVFCLLGANGAGKTTTLEVLQGFVAPTRGSVRVFGMDPSSQPIALRRRVGVVLQSCGMPDHLRVSEIVDAWRSYYPDPLGTQVLLAMVGLEGQAARLVRQLSGGQQRRLDFALALSGDPDLIYLDEPTTGYDPEARARCWQVIDNLRDLGKTIVLTTHYLDEVEALADRVGVLAGGRINDSDTPSRLARRLRPGSVIALRLPESSSAAALASTFEERLTVSGRQVTIDSFDVEADLRELISWSDASAPGALDSLAVRPPRLEDVFAELVGVDEVNGGAP